MGGVSLWAFCTCLAYVALSLRAALSVAIWASGGSLSGLGPLFLGCLGPLVLAAAAKKDKKIGNTQHAVMERWVGHGQPWLFVLGVSYFQQPPLGPAGLPYPSWGGPISSRDGGIPTTPGGSLPPH